MESDITFFADYWSTYPQSIPRVVDVNASLFEYYERGGWKLHLALRKLFNQSFRADEVCIYDWFLKCNPVIHCLGSSGFDMAKFAKLAADLDITEIEWRWTKRQRPMDMERALSSGGCTICLDEHMTYEMVDLVCGYVFCMEYFHFESTKFLLELSCLWFLLQLLWTLLVAFAICSDIAFKSPLFRDLTSHRGLEHCSKDQATFHMLQ